METFRGNAAVERVATEFYDAGKPTAVVCHATSLLLDVRSASGEPRSSTPCSHSHRHLV